jgi:protein-tyrosine phosphatase
MAEGILKKKLNTIERSDIAVSSMGIHGLEGHSASDYAVDICKTEDIDLSMHSSRPLMPEELIKCDLIFTMELLHNEFILTYFPRIKGKTFLLGAWPQSGTKKDNIEDPIGGTVNKYRKSFKEISFHIERILPLLLAQFPKESKAGE